MENKRMVLFIIGFVTLFVSIIIFINSYFTVLDYQTYSGQKEREVSDEAEAEYQEARILIIFYGGGIIIGIVMIFVGFSVKKDQTITFPYQPPYPPSILPQPVKYCNRCKRQIPIESESCPYCTTKID